MSTRRCRFVLHNINEDEARDKAGFDIFEPSIVLEIDGRSSFDALDARSVDHVVVMHSREEWLKDTLKMIDQPGEYLYPFYGTAYSIRALATRNEVEISVQANSAHGPLFGGKEGRHVVGLLPLKEWVQAIVDVSRQLSDIFRRLHPTLFSDRLFLKQEMWSQELESWLIAQEPGRGGDMARITPREQLLARFREVMDVPFPRPATDDPDIWDLHGDIAEWDASVAGYMSGVVEKFEKGEAAPQRLRLRIPSFEKKIQRLLQEKPQHSEILLEYRKHYRRWIDFSELAERLRKGRLTRRERL